MHRSSTVYNSTKQICQIWILEERRVFKVKTPSTAVKTELLCCLIHSLNSF